jgi:periplasmic divalent cation tolerance protein
VSGVFQIASTIDSREAAQSLADALVERRLAACVQIAGPISSTYRWEGELRHDDEFLLLCKVPEERLREAIAAIEELHSYDVPEVLAFEVDAGSPSYLDWVTRESGVVVPPTERQSCGL